MSGYKRVNFYELCRLCASNQQKVKTHIFQEEGRMMQLQSKIQSCLSLRVCENDYLPKVVCSQCVSNLEECYNFRQACSTSETMLSSYFNKFRYTEDFIKSGKVYIKDDTPKAVSTESTHVDVLPPPVQEKHYYTLQVPTLNAQSHSKTLTYNVKAINVQEIKGIGGGGGGGDLLGLPTPVEVENCYPKHKSKEKSVNEEELLKIDLLETAKEGRGEVYPLKIPEQDSADVSFNQSVIFNALRSKSTSTSSLKLDYVPGKSQMALQVTEAIPPMDPPEPPPTKPDGKAHTCDVCQKQFKRRELLYQHLKLHMGFRPFRCESCSKAFMRKEHLLRHMTSHSGQKNFTCTVCEKSFSRNDNLLKHRKIHAKQANFVCEICQKQFVMEHYYVAHKVAHEAEGGKCIPPPAWSLLKT